MPDSLAAASAALPPMPEPEAQLAALDRAIAHYRAMGDHQHLRYFRAERRRLHNRFIDLGLLQGEKEVPYNCSLRPREDKTYD